MATFIPNIDQALGESFPPFPTEIITTIIEQEPDIAGLAALAAIAVLKNTIIAITANQVADEAQLAFLGITLGAIEDELKKAPGIITAAIQGIVNLLQNISLKEIYHWIQDLIALAKRVQAWLQKYVIGPIQAEQKQLQALYNKFFLPIIKLFQHLEQLVGIIGIFDKGLASKIDQALWSLEVKITAPILRQMQRLNAMSSTLSAFFTLGGYIDRTTSLSTIWRDAGLIRQVLHNPLNFLEGKPTPVAGTPVTAQAAPFQQWLINNTGDVADQVSTSNQNINQYLQELAPGVQLPF